MASLEHYMKKYGAWEGRRRYNAFHRAYRKRRKAHMLAYWKTYRERVKARR